MPVSPRAAVAAVLATGTAAAISGCATNLTHHTFHSWESALEREGIHLEQYKRPRTRGSGFSEKYVGVFEVDFRVINRSEEPRCTKLSVTGENIHAYAGPLEELKVVLPGQTIDGARVSPGQGESEWTATMKVQGVYTDGDGYACEPPSNSSSEDCYITTAMCEQTGRPDDCRELESLRAFRDGPLRHMPGGEALIADYYRTAPGLVRAIDRDPARASVYRELRESYIRPAAEAADRGDHQRARALYTAMVRQLSERYPGAA